MASSSGVADQNSGQPSSDNNRNVRNRDSNEPGVLNHSVKSGAGNCDNHASSNNQDKESVTCSDKVSKTGGEAKKISQI